MAGGGSSISSRDSNARTAASTAQASIDRRRDAGDAYGSIPRATVFSAARCCFVWFCRFFFVPARTIIEFCRRSTFSFCPSIDTSWRRSSAISDRLFTGFFHRKQKRPTGPRHGLTTLYRTSKLSLLPPSYVCGVGGSGGSDVVGSIRGAASPTASLFCRVSCSSTTPRWPPRDRRTRRASPHVAGVCRVRIGVGLIGQRGRVGEKRNARATTLPWAALGWVGGGEGAVAMETTGVVRSIRNWLAERGVGHLGLGHTDRRGSCVAGWRHHLPVECVSRRKKNKSEAEKMTNGLPGRNVARRPMRARIRLGRQMGTHLHSRAAIGRRRTTTSRPTNERATGAGQPERSKASRRGPPFSSRHWPTVMNDVTAGQ